MTPVPVQGAFILELYQIFHDFLLYLISLASIQCTWVGSKIPSIY